MKVSVAVASGATRAAPEVVDRRLQRRDRIGGVGAGVALFRYIHPR
jgi:hypothetical protein